MVRKIFSSWIFFLGEITEKRIKWMKTKKQEKKINEWKGGREWRSVWKKWKIIFYNRLFFFSLSLHTPIMIWILPVVNLVATSLTPLVLQVTGECKIDCNAVKNAYNESQEREGISCWSLQPCWLHVQEHAWCIRSGGRVACQSSLQTAHGECDSVEIFCFLSLLTSFLRWRSFFAKIRVMGCLHFKMEGSHG